MVLKRAEFAAEKFRRTQLFEPIPESKKQYKVFSAATVILLMRGFPEGD